MKNAFFPRSISLGIVPGLILLGISCTGFCQSKTVTGPTKVQNANGALVICGGGKMPDSVFKCFRDLAGSPPKLVVIPTASIRADDSTFSRSTIDLWKARGFKNIVILHTRDRKIANSDAFAQPLKSATAVWIGGGSQSKIADAYLGTQTESEIYRVKERGGVIGGTSAGAAIMSKVMIAFGSPEPTIKTGFDLFNAAIVDQHFVKRKRQTRLKSAIKNHPKLTGYGIDEGTALIVEKNLNRVVGKSTVTTIRFNGSSFVVKSYSSGETITE